MSSEHGMAQMRGKVEIMNRFARDEFEYGIGYRQCGPSDCTLPVVNIKLKVQLSCALVH